SQLVFSELKLVIYTKQGQAIAFKSNILVHSNLSVTSDNSDSKIDTSMKNNCNKLVILKHTIQNKKFSKTSKFVPQLQK
ncbi:20348_t:CDS:2, partial [Gigaspora rosea]